VKSAELRDAPLALDEDGNVAEESIAVSTDTLSPPTLNQIHPDVYHNS